MLYLIVLACLVLIPFFAITGLRAHGSIVFLSLCLGSMLAMHVAPDVADVITAVNRGNVLATLQWTQAGLLVTPFVLAMLFTRGAIRGGKQILNILNAFASGTLFALLLTPYLPASWQDGIQSLVVWRQLDNLQTAILIMGATISLLFLLMTRPHHKNDKRHGK
jgi:hypothetical protein